MQNKNSTKTKEGFCDELEEDLRSRKYIYWLQNQLHPTGTLAVDFLEPMGEANMYFRFVYVPKKICNRVWGQISGLINDYPINTNEKVNHQRH